VQAANISSMGFASSSEDSIKIHKQLDNPIWPLPKNSRTGSPGGTPNFPLGTWLGKSS
jgi:hypothetical protein